ncbi:MAG TPA: hypothetical protein VEX37_04170, partial [Thermomicrobiales bacterium]|nr:hypothetical protein [Thermomicrobiales bacterium]
MRIAVRTIELDDPLTTIGGLDGYSSVKGLVRLHQTPVGYIDMPVTNGQCSAGSIRDAILKHLDTAIVRHLLVDALAMEPRLDGVQPADLIDAVHARERPTQPFVTVAVCTRDRPDDLRLCLDALARLDYTNHEVIVVDNA